MRTLKQRLRDGEHVLICGIGRVFHHNLIHVLGLCGGFQGVWFDMEHVGLTTEQLEFGTLAARHHGMDVFCRVAPTDYASVTRCFEAGSSGIMAAQIYSAKQAEEFVRWSKFMPRGNRGLNSGGWDGKFGGCGLADFCRQSNEDTLVMIQIETAQAVEEADAIAAIDGVDGLFVGPADLSQNLGVVGEMMHDKCIAALDRVSAACKKHGKCWGAVSWGNQHAQMLVDKGCRMLSPCSDLRLLRTGIEAIKKDFANVVRT
jgi:2-dehydro-3-deoxyglucarate aldolase/4-hydroxy-2-oxoheptanedioate aldolase